MPDLEALFGLPREVKFCRICNITNQRPNSVNEYEHVRSSVKSTIQFNEDGVCAGCINKERQHLAIDWKKREEELWALCDHHRKSDGNYDCIVPGSGGKDSIYASWLLKYKFKMHPLTVTWSPHLYTDVGWRNFQSWIHKGGFDNFLFTPNGKSHRLLTRLAVQNLLHPFQPFILGQKTFVTKMCARMDISLAFYGEMPGEYGTTGILSASGEEKKFSGYAGSGFSTDMLGGRDVMDLYLGGVSVKDIVEKHGVALVDLKAYLPLEAQIVREKKIDIYFTGYFVKWDPQECYYFSVEKTGFEANPVRTEGTYSKYNSLDDRIDGYFYYTSWIKFGMGRAMQDSAQEIRNKKITTDEGRALIKKFDGEFPLRYYKEFLEYIGMTDKEFRDICDSFRSSHLWAKVNGEWRLRHTANNDGVDD
ncbi:MAG: N-acetyl sugar amidotransferase [Candidatus Omnitrophica bacterium]|nr:N-acetyl sugar amidotransferase [Candidatus Omnitrophota bacterium]